MPDTTQPDICGPADPTRRAMLARLSKGEANVSDLAKPFLKSMSLPAVTKHLKVLEKAGLITKTRDAQWRPCKLNGDGLKDVADWMEQYRQFWEESFDRLEAYLKTVTVEERMRKERNMAAKNKSNEIQHHPRSTTRRSRPSGTPGPIPSKSPSGGDRAASRSPRTAKTCGPAATGPTRCTARTARLPQQDALLRSRKAREARLRPRRQRRSAAAVPRDGAVLRDRRQDQDGHDA